MGGVPSIPTDPSREIQVISAGFSRTGTASMSLALAKLLNGPVCHGGTQLLGREDAYVRKWIKVYELRHDRPNLLKALREATRGFVAIADVPGNHFIEELQELYPEAKVVDVNRDPVKWWASLENVINKASPWWLHYFLLPMPGWRWFPRAIECMTQRSIEMIGIGMEGPGLLEHHHQWLREIVPENNLYVVELKDGWAPLCKMLDLPIPDSPFPRVNDTDAIEGLRIHIFLKTAVAWLMLCTAMVSSIRALL
ncbi:unnamed protein product [Clonostachys rosea f. rosea IK726]|uniref:Uncharacterized protein n=1 Tax=Clonostachys rosea f. rosea IK726 TaxID=1349383 RepID=A0ACA9UBU5_BIOOC|nr:unnamed protein product [Clonostachys rosea f. rosea IK726]